jgi:PAS domain S-box-containing protein
MRRRSRAGSTKPLRRKAPAAKRRRGVKTTRGVTSSASKEKFRFALLSRKLSEARRHRRRAQEALRESEYKLRQIIESTFPGMLWVTGPDGEVTRVNQRTLDFTGARSVADIRNLGWQKFLHPEDFPKTANAFLHAVQTGGSYENLQRVRRVDGEYRWHHVRAEPLRDREGRIIEWYGLSVDIDDAKKAEERLRRSEAHLTQAQRLSHTGSWAVNETTTLHWSEESYRIWGFDPLQGLPSSQAMLQRIHPDDRDRVTQGGRDARREKRDFTGEFRIILPDRTVKYLETEATIRYFGDEDRYEAIGTHVDVTERKRAEARLRVQHTVAQILAEGATIEEVTPRMLRAIGECLGWDVGALWRVDRGAEALRCVEFWHKASIEVPEFERLSREFTFVPGVGLPGRVWSSLEPEYISDVVPDENFPRAPIAELEGLRAAFAFPVRLGERALGVIEFFSREIRQPDQELLNVLATIGSQIGQFIERKRAEQALREREAKIRRLVDANIIGIFIWDFDGRILEANEAFLRIVGYDHEDLVAGRLRWTDLTPPEWRDRDAQLIQEHRITGTLQPFEKEYFRKDGGRVPVLIGVATFEGSENQGVAFVIDLTERKRAEETLRRDEAWLAQAQRLSHTGTWVMDGTTRRFLYWSDEGYRIWGLDPLQGLPSREDMWGRIHPDDRERLWGEVQEAMREQRDFFAEFRLLLPGGTVKYLEANAHHVFSPLGALLEVLCTSVDVTERKRAEESLRRGEAWLAQAQRPSHTGTWVMDGTTRRFLYWSDESYRIWGLDPLQGLPSREDYWGRVHPDDREWVWEEVQKAMREQSDFLAEYRVLLPDGAVKYVETNTHHEFSPGGALLEAVWTSVDVTERKRAQDEHERLRQLESDLAHMNRVSMMGELAASLSHEIAQPIATARNNARAAMHFLARSPSEPGEAEEALACVVNDADRAAEILGRIRDQIKKTPPRVERIDLNRAIADVIALAQSAIIQNGISVQTDLIEALPHVQADRVQLQQVILNLILNAVEAMSSVEKRVRKLSIGAEQHQSGGVLVSVRDSGPGIDSEHLNRVFDAFYTTKSRGVGMGLSICRSIIRAHSGELWADVNPSGGAVFRFTLPSVNRSS